MHAQPGMRGGRPRIDTNTSWDGPGHRTMKISRTSIPAGKGRAGIVIGCCYTGKYAGHVDTTTGVYWEALPKITGSALTIQSALLAKPKADRRPVRERFNTTIDTALAQFTERRLKPRGSLPSLVGMQK